MKTAKLLIAVAFVLVVISSLADDPTAVPTRFKASIRTFKRPSYTVELKDGVLVYSKMDHSTNTEIKITPTVAQWQEFRYELDHIKVWPWQSRYENIKVFDGTGWLLIIEYADKHIRTAGGNSYPDAAGKPSEDSKPTKTFEIYLTAVQKLLGGEKFER